MKYELKQPVMIGQIEAMEDVGDLVTLFVLFDSNNSKKSVTEVKMGRFWKMLNGPVVGDYIVRYMSKQWDYIDETNKEIPKHGLIKKDMFEGCFKAVEELKK